MLSYNNLIFSVAEDQQGNLVHVDEVQNGLACGCVCPYCHEPLKARQGDVREHGFAHHGHRGANLKICYQVTLYKLAEQIIRTNKSIFAPSYFGIFPSKRIEFVDVQVDSRFEREDKQPDVIATTSDRKVYLIEFIFSLKAQHKKAIDYQNLSCIEVSLKNQTLDSVKEFLLNSDKERSWLNNENYFNSLEKICNEKGRNIKVVSKDECNVCLVKHNCCAARYKDSKNTVLVENNGSQFKLCELDKKKKALEEQEERRIKAELEREKRAKELEELRKRWQEQERIKKEQELLRHAELEIANAKKAEDIKIEREQAFKNSFHYTCFDCANNLRHDNIGGFASCGSWRRLGVPRQTPPNTAKGCRSFDKK